MSSFKRKNLAKQVAVSFPGTRASPASSSTIITSTGISSLDDILGGGIPLSCSMVVAAPDFHSLYGELVQKYFIAEGLACGHRLCVIDGDPANFVKDLPWFSKSITPNAGNVNTDEDSEGKADQKVKIAWRYEQMKQFQTTVQTLPSASNNFCHNFDLSSRVPEGLVDEAIRSAHLSLLTATDVTSPAGKSRTGSTLINIEKQLQQDNSVPLRICIPSLGSPVYWGDVTSETLLYFLHSLRGLLRRYSHGCASVSLAPHLSNQGWGEPGWLQKVGWLSDASMTMSAFSADPSLSSIFPSHHGLVNILSLPSPNTLVSPSDRFSTLRGLASSSSGGTGENNIAFKCTRKRLIFETLHLDLEGGVAERRTTAPTAVELSTSLKDNIMDHLHHEHVGPAAAKIDIQLEGLEIQQKDTETPESKPVKPKKKVAFFSDRPDLYDY